MRRLIQAVSEFFEAKAELLREEAATLNLGTYARGYKDAQEDNADFEFNLIDETEGDEG
jgi:hypothetical protein